LLTLLWLFTLAQTAFLASLPSRGFLARPPLFFAKITVYPSLICAFLYETLPQIATKGVADAYAVIMLVIIEGFIIVTAYHSEKQSSSTGPLKVYKPEREDSDLLSYLFLYSFYKVQMLVVTASIKIERKRQQ